MKKEYNIKDKVWIHLGERTLVEGRVVDIFDLHHVGYPKDREFYVIEIQTGIDNIFEVRDFEQISPDSKGPINLFRHIKDDMLKAKRFLKKVGINLPVDGPHPLEEFIGDGHDGMGSLAEDYEDGPSPDEIHAAIDKSLKDTAHTPLNLKSEKPKRRNYPPRKKKV